MNQRDKLLNLESHLNTHIKGQDHVIERLTSVLKRGELGLASSGRPKGSFLLVGPTGTGKTEITQCFTDYLYGEDHLIRFDMSEFMTKDSVSKLIVGGVGDAGLLGHKLSQMSKGTLLFDEMEKADPRILDLFLQMLDAGRITLGDHTTRSLNDFYIVFTSNIGSSEIRNMTRCPFSTIERTVLSQVNEHLRPELVGRIKEKLVFKVLTYDVQKDICLNLAQKHASNLADLGHYLNLTDETIEFLMNVGFNSKLGARPLREAIEKHLGDLIAERILSGENTNGTVISDKLKTKLVFKEKESCYEDKNSFSSAGKNSDIYQYF